MSNHEAPMIQLATTPSGGQPCGPDGQTHMHAARCFDAGYRAGLLKGLGYDPTDPHTWPESALERILNGIEEL